MSILRNALEGLNALVEGMKLHTDMAGLLSIEFEPWCLHLFPRRFHWVWGYCDGWYDGPIPTWGLGPLFLLVCFWPDAWCKKHRDYFPDCGCTTQPSGEETNQ